MNAATFFGFLFSLLFMSVGCASQPISVPIDNPWSKVTTPSHAEAESFGSTSAGCLSGAVHLPEVGLGYFQMRQERHRDFGHPKLVLFLQQSARALREKFSASLLIADLSQPRGGPTLSGHASHQTGLDVDIWFANSGDFAPLQLENTDRSKLSAPDLVDGVEMIPNANFKDSQIEVLHYFASQTEVDRIFVSPGIKKKLCETHKNEWWLQKIRPWFGHREHFHMRLKCSAADSQCIPTEVLPEGNSCDGSLDWWWSEEARRADSAPSKPPKMPVLPKACEEVLRSMEQNPF